MDKNIKVDVTKLTLEELKLEGKNLKLGRGHSEYDYTLSIVVYSNGTKVCELFDDSYGSGFDYPKIYNQELFDLLKEKAKTHNEFESLDILLDEEVIKPAWKAKEEADNLKRMKKQCLNKLLFKTPNQPDNEYSYFSCKEGYEKAREKVLQYALNKYGEDILIFNENFDWNTPLSQVLDAMKQPKKVESKTITPTPKKPKKPTL